MRRFLLSLFSHRTLALLRWDVHFIGVKLRNAVGRRGGQALLEGRTRPVYLNLGSGPRGLDDPGWINVDGYADTNVDLCVDLNSGLPFPPETFAGIFCEHVFEHFDLEHGLALFRECYRVLQPGGGMRIIVPDGEKIMRTYFEAPADLVSRRQSESGCAMEAVNSYFRQRYEHQCLYDRALLSHQLKRAGFEKITPMSYKAGMSEDLLLDDAKYEWESVYVEAIKAGAFHG